MPPSEGRCREPKCRQPIVWVVTERGARMPLNPAPDAGGNVVLVRGRGGTRGRVLTGNELPWTGSLNDAGPFVPHHRTCVGAPGYRAPRTLPGGRREVLVDRCPVCTELMSPWLRANGYRQHIGCLPPLVWPGTVDGWTCTADQLTTPQGSR